MAVGQIITKALGSIARKMERAGGRNLTRLNLMARAVQGQRRPPSLGPSGRGLRQAEPESWTRRLLDRIGGSSNANQAGRDTPGWAQRLAGAVRSQRMVVDHRDADSGSQGQQGAGGGIMGQIASALANSRRSAGGAAPGGPGAAGATGGRPRSAQAPGRVAAGAVGSIGTSAGLAAGAVALGLTNPVTAAVGVLAGAFATLTVAGNDLADSLLESQRGLASFNGTIAVAYMKLQHAEVRRSIESAGRRASAFEEFAEKTEHFEESAQELKDLAAILGMQIGGWVKGTLASMLDKLKQLGPIKEAIEDMNRKAKPDSYAYDIIDAWAGERRKRETPKPRLPVGGK